MKKYHLTQKNNDWRLLGEGNKRSTLNFEGLTKNESEKLAIDYMKEHGGSLKIHKLDGKIQEERTYPRSADPKESEG